MYIAVESDFSGLIDLLILLAVGASALIGASAKKRAQANRSQPADNQEKTPMFPLPPPFFPSPMPVPMRIDEPIPPQNKPAESPVIFDRTPPVTAGPASELQEGECEHDHGGALAAPEPLLPEVAAYHPIVRAVRQPDTRRQAILFAEILGPRRGSGPYIKR